MVEIADIFRQHADQYLVKYGSKIPASHKKAIKDIINCRTPALGGVVYHCPKCDQYDYSYHSCGNRNCPKCQNDKAEQWLEKNIRLLLPADYFMITFTLPDKLRKIARSNQRLFYQLLFKCSSKAIVKLSSDEKYIGGKPGMLGVLHSWSRDLSYHPHVHYIIPGGGLSSGKWKTSGKNFLLPVKALSVVFRAKFRDGLKKANPALFKTVSSNLWRTKWVVNSIPVGSGKHAMKYLAQYVFRVAISNNKILSHKDGTVTFRYKDSQTKTWETKRLRGEEFMRRFLQHVLPPGFVKVRYYGLFANANRALLQSLAESLNADLAVPESSPETKKKKPFICSACNETMIVVLRSMRRYAGVDKNKSPPMDMPVNVKI